jgi:hypothetical protein
VPSAETNIVLDRLEDDYSDEEEQFKMPVRTPLPCLLKPSLSVRLHAHNDPARTGTNRRTKTHTHARARKRAPRHTHAQLGHTVQHWARRQPAAPRQRSREHTRGLAGWLGLEHVRQSTAQAAEEAKDKHIKKMKDDKRSEQQEVTSHQPTRARASTPPHRHWRHGRPRSQRFG